GGGSRVICQANRLSTQCGPGGTVGKLRNSAAEVWSSVIVTGADANARSVPAVSTLRQGPGSIFQPSSAVFGTGFAVAHQRQGRWSLSLVESAGSSFSSSEPVAGGRQQQPRVAGVDSSGLAGGEQGAGQAQTTYGRPAATTVTAVSDTSRIRRVLRSFLTTPIV